jgi:molybdopterin converting factor small subunit
MIRVSLPAHLRTLAHIEGDVVLQLEGPATQRSVLDALEDRYPVLRGTIREQVTQRTSRATFMIVGAMAGG